MICNDRRLPRAASGRDQRILDNNCYLVGILRDETSAIRLFSSALRSTVHLAEAYQMLANISSHMCQSHFSVALRGCCTQPA